MAATPRAEIARVEGPNPRQVGAEKLDHAIGNALQFFRERARTEKLFLQRIQAGQSQFHALPLGDVAAGFDNVSHLARRIEDRRCADFDEDLLSLGIIMRMRDPGRHSGGHHLLQRARLMHPITRSCAMVGELMAGEANRGIDVAGDLAGGPIGQGDVVVSANHQKGFRQRVDHRLQESDCFLHLVLSQG